MPLPPRSYLSCEQLESRDVPSAAPIAPPGGAAPGRYIVTLQSGVDAQEFAAELRGSGRVVNHVYTRALNGVSIQGMPPGLDPRVLAVEPDRMVSIEGKSTSPPPPPPPPPAPAEILPPGVERVWGGTQPPSAGNLGGVKVAVIDTGIDRAHPDLNVAGGRNFVGTKPDQWGDDNGHGTHVAGTIGALDNDIGVVGVAPGVSLYGVKVLNRNGSGWISDIIAGVNWVTENNIAVANMSLGFYGYSEALHGAIQKSVAAGVVYVTSAGNSAMDTGGFSPASFPEVIAVSAMVETNGVAGGSGSSTSYGADDTLATFSNYGAAVDLAAPGVNVRSTLPGGRYGLMSGTSMASPHVAGVVALYIARNGRDVTGDGAVNKADVDAIRLTLVGAAQPMADWRPDSGDTSSDSDAYHEGLVQIVSDAAPAAAFLPPADGTSGNTGGGGTVESSATTRRPAGGGASGAGGGAAGAETTVSSTGTFFGQPEAEVRTLFDVDPLDRVLLLP